MQTIFYANEDSGGMTSFLIQDPSNEHGYSYFQHPAQIVRAGERTNNIYFVASTA